MMADQPLPNIPEKEKVEVINCIVLRCKQLALLETMIDGKKYYRCPNHGVVISEKQYQQMEKKDKNVKKNY